MEFEPKDAMSFREFCKRNSISLSFLYELIKENTDGSNV
jgi:hypothetical protein